MYILKWFLNERFEKWNILIDYPWDNNDNKTHETRVSLERIIILKHEYKTKILPKRTNMSISSQPSAG